MSGALRARVEQYRYHFAEQQLGKVWSVLKATMLD